MGSNVLVLGMCTVRLLRGTSGHLRSALVVCSNSVLRLFSARTLILVLCTCMYRGMHGCMQDLSLKYNCSRYVAQMLLYYCLPVRILLEGILKGVSLFIIVDLNFYRP